MCPAGRGARARARSHENENELNQELEKIYLDPSNPGSLGGVDKLFRAASKQLVNYKITLNNVKQFLKQAPEYTLYKPAVRRHKRQPMLAMGGVDSIWQLDLAVLINIAQYNDGYNYILMGVDIFSRYAFAQPLKTKNAADVLLAFKAMLEKHAQEEYARWQEYYPSEWEKIKTGVMHALPPNYFFPKKIHTDQGKEFLNFAFQNFLQANDIAFYSAINDTKAAIVERLNRTIKEKMWRYFGAHNTFRWVDILQDLVKSYNNSFHRTIQTTPAKARLASTEKKLRSQYGKLRIPTKKKEIKFKLNDPVRITKYKGIFVKGYEQKWTEEIFFIDKIYSQTSPPMYRLRDSQDESIKGRYYNQDLQLVTKPEFYKVEAILQSRKLAGKPVEVLVKWKGYPHSANTWEPRSELADFISETENPAPSTSRQQQQQQQIAKIKRRTRKQK